MIISVSRLDRALACYAGLLGLSRRAARLRGPAAWRRASAVELMLRERPTHPSMAGVALSVRVDDVNTMAEEAQRIGCVVIDQPTDQPSGERLAVLTDPDCHMICLSTPI